ncbi:hypothetical protein FHS20_004388 [Phyllobacterium endophyticum]|nr:hypothetical protein [Phyllobacterium endophyticum]
MSCGTLTVPSCEVAAARSGRRYTSSQSRAVDRIVVKVPELTCKPAHEARAGWFAERMARKLASTGTPKGRTTTPLSTNSQADAALMMAMPAPSLTRVKAVCDRRVSSLERRGTPASVTSTRIAKMVPAQG